MLPLSELHRVVSSVDERWSSPIADAAAAPWGLPPGTALLWRTSSAHVFVVPRGRDPRGVLYVRAVPAALVALDGVEATTRLLHAWADAGHDVVAPVPSAAGHLVETVDAPGGALHVMVVPAAAGDPVDVDDLTVEQACAWGAALARLHAAAPQAVGLPQWATPVVTLDAQLAAAVATLDAARAALDPTAHARGVLHGDFELDNVRFDDGRVVAFDTDDAAIGWFAADVAAATRSLTGAEPGDRPRPVLLTAFLDGYRAVRGLSDEELAALELHAAIAAARTAAHLESVLDAGHRSSDPRWLRELRETLVGFRERIVASTPCARPRCCEGESRIDGSLIASGNGRHQHGRVVRMMPMSAIRANRKRRLSTD